MRALGLAVAVTVVVLEASCATELSQIKQELGVRAGGDLNCDVPDLTYQETEVTFGTIEVRVSGCHRSEVYRKQNDTWILQGKRAASFGTSK
jgi:hypothetical protein